MPVMAVAEVAETFATMAAMAWQQQSTQSDDAVAEGCTPGVPSSMHDSTPQGCSDVSVQFECVAGPLGTVPGVPGCPGPTVPVGVTPGTGPDGVPDMGVGVVPGVGVTVGVGVDPGLGVEPGAGVNGTIHAAAPGNPPVPSGGSNGP